MFFRGNNSTLLIIQLFNYSKIKFVLCLFLNKVDSILPL